MKSFLIGLFIGLALVALGILVGAEGGRTNSDDLRSLGFFIMGLGGLAVVLGVYFFLISPPRGQRLESTTDSSALTSEQPGSTTDVLPWRIKPFGAILIMALAVCFVVIEFWASENAPFFAGARVARLTVALGLLVLVIVWRIKLSGLFLKPVVDPEKPASLLKQDPRDLGNDDSVAAADGGFPATKDKPLS